MKTTNFINLANAITGRDFQIKAGEDILFDTEYKVFRVLPLTGIVVSFKWKTAKTEDKMLKSFITAFCNKYREPNPRAYNKVYGGTEYKWSDKTDKEKEYAYLHHSSNMYSKIDLMNQIEANFGKENVYSTLMTYGFYPTMYGVGIFALFNTEYVAKAIDALRHYLKKQNIPFTNEFSEARWVYRFKIGLSKENHESIIYQFSNGSKSV